MRNCNCNNHPRDKFTTPHAFSAIQAYCRIHQSTLITCTVLGVLGILGYLIYQGIIFAPLRALVTDSYVIFILVLAWVLFGTFFLFKFTLVTPWWGSGIAAPIKMRSPEFLLCFFMGNILAFTISQTAFVLDFALE
jgi:hypothetical protein